MNDANPFKTISSKELYVNPWIRLVEDQILKPNGEPGIYGKLHFNNYALGIVAVSENMDIWLVGQYRYVLKSYSWEIPIGGGALEAPPLEGAKRELREETGLTANRWEELIRIHLSNSVTDEYGMVFLAEELTIGSTEFDDTEILEIKRMPFANALKMVMNGEITDSMSVTGILAAANKWGILTQR